MAIETLGAALRQVNRLFTSGAVTGFSDAQLLERFVADRDAAAFEVLVVRHGPMVLSVCRGILHDPNDAEDAFQATFLILVKKAATFRGQVALAGWLYLVAHRVAVRANAAAARRRAHERWAGQMAAATKASGRESRDDLLPALHDEIARLPEKFRLAIVLCDLQGMPQDRAAGELRLSERTLRRRLSDGRKRLKSRLGRRGLAREEGMLGMVFLREGRVAVRAGWGEATARAALATVNRTVTAGVVSAAVKELTGEVLKIMLIQKLKLVSSTLLGAGLIAWGMSAALMSRGDEPPKTVPAVAARTAIPPPASQPEAVPDTLDAVGTFPVHGHVLDPDGKPVAGAEIYVHHFANDIMASATSYTMPSYKSGRVATNDSAGRFRFDLDKAASDFSYLDDPAWHHAQIAAVAPGFGPAWVKAGSLLKGDEATLRLARDDVSIRARVVDFEGRPVAGVTVHAREIRDADEKTEKDALLASGVLDFARTASQFAGPTWLGKNGTWTTDGDGRFEVKGLGRDRIVGLEFQSSTHEKVYLYAMARVSASPPSPRPRPTRPAEKATVARSPRRPLVGASFEQIVGPSKPIIGVVRLKGSGKPVAGVHVLGVEPMMRTEVSALTGAEGRFRLVGLPKAASYRVRAAPRPGIDPFLGAEITVTDTAGLAPIETVLELPRGVIVTGRLIDSAASRAVRAKHVMHTKLPSNHNDGHATLGTSGLIDPTFRLTVPPGQGMLYANIRGDDTAYTRARLRQADRGKGVGGIGDNETVTTRLDGYHAYRIIDVPADSQPIDVSLELTRGETRKGRLVGPTGKPVVGAQCSGHATAYHAADVKTLTDDTFDVFGLTEGHPRLVIFSHKDLGLAGWVMITDKEIKSEAPLVVRLERDGSIKGRLIDEVGVAVPGATLSIQTHYADDREFWRSGERFATDANGRFELTGLSPGVKLSVYVGNKSRRLDTGDVFRNMIVESGKTLDVGDVKVKEETQ